MSGGNHHLRLLALGLFVAVAAALYLIPTSEAVAVVQSNDKGEFFEARIRPVLANNCYACHASAAKGGLRLDSRQGILSGGSRGPAMVPGRPEESLLIQAVTYAHESLRMPQGGKKLRGDEIADLIKWVKDGAVWPESAGEIFASRVRPVLESSCLACHGDSPQGGLRLDSRAAVLKGGASGPAIVPGDPDKSLLVQSVRYSHPKIKMPPGKKLPEEQIAAFVEWVKAGAEWSDKAGSTSAAAGEFTPTPEQKSFWSFQPLKAASPPAIKQKRWPRSAVDRFILAKLEERNLKPGAPADKRALIRRATFDLTGLPPTPEDTEAFVRDKSPGAFAKVVDRLLASPRYGERWGRHWLDLVRYADSAGDSSDYPVPQAHLYRDYVIASFNRDKPYDQFIREQIAGDLLPARSEAEKWERTIATGYLASARRFSVEPEKNMHLTIEDTIDNVGKTVIGLSVSCARCHDHKYDPISAKDYYALYGIFNSTRYPFAGSENIQEQRDLVFRKSKAEVDAALKPTRDQLAPLDAELKRLEKEKQKIEAAEEGEAKDEAQAGMRRTLKQINSEISVVKKRRVPVIEQMPALEQAFAVAEGTAKHARLQRRGEPRNLGEEVPRRFLTILGGQALPPDVKGSGRLQLAEWLTDARNPLTARVMVNRVWQHHFGRGLVTTPSDFGKRGKAPTHPELLDYLAAEFVKSNWSLKAMHRLIMTSQVYQLASAAPPGASVDPANELLSRFNRRRLDAEEIRDALLMIGGKLDATGAGAHPFPHPSKWDYTQHKPFTAVYANNKRSVYLMTQRIQRHPYLAVFDGADPNASTPERTATTTPIQALFMMNSAFLHEQAEALAEQLMKDAPEDRARVDRAYRKIFARPATPEESAKAEEYLKLSAAKLAADTPAEQRHQKALASFLRVLLSSNEFIFVD